MMDEEVSRQMMVRKTTAVFRGFHRGDRPPTKTIWTHQVGATCQPQKTRKKSKKKKKQKSMRKKKSPHRTRTVLVMEETEVQVARGARQP